MHHSVWREKQSSALSCVSCADPFTCLLCLVSDAKLSPKTGYLSLFSLPLMESQPERESCIFSALRQRCSGLSKCSESTIYKQRRHGDKRVLERLLCLFHAQYGTMSIMII